MHREWGLDICVALLGVRPIWRRIPAPTAWGVRCGLERTCSLVCKMWSEALRLWYWCDGILKYRCDVHRL